MRKLLLTVAVAATSIFAANAQADSDLVQIGAKAGVNFATVAGDDIESPDARTSFNVGFVAEVPYTERFSLQAEVMYSGQGFEFGNVLNTGDKAEYQLDYIQIPLLAKVYIFDGLNVYAGPQIGFKINEEVDYDPSSDGGDINLDETPLAEAQDIDFSGAIGAGYKFSNGFFVDARYNYGFSELIEDSNVHNSVIQAGVGFMF